ncbi:MAG: FtsX-like permease family protein [Proteobacteria bacterium]|nr:FtsX-like permease family protein [Pseudomonadota bacterium]
MSERVPAVERWLAWRYLATRQREGFVSFIAIVSMIGVALGVATLIVVLSVMGGFREQLIGRLIGMNGHIVVTAREGMVQATSDLLEKLRATPGVKTLRLTLERQALLSANGQTRGAIVRGVRLEDLTSREIITKGIVDGQLGGFDVRRGVVMGQWLRQALNIRVGDHFSIVTQKMGEGGAVAPRYADYELLATFITKRYEFDQSLVFVPLRMLQEDLEYDRQTVSSIDLELTDPNAAPAVAAAIRANLKRDDLKIADWQALNARFMGALQVERVMMFIILSLIVLVAAMNVVASFTMLVRVKRGNIAILRTMGAGGGTIVRAFFMAAAGVGLVGTVAGTALGLFICANTATIGRWLGEATASGKGAAEVDFITSMPARIDPVEVLSIVGVAILLSLAAAAYPAWRSTKVEPVEGLRHE